MMDINAGAIATGEKSIAEAGWEMFQLMLDAASGKKNSWAELLEAALHRGSVQSGAGGLSGDVHPPPHPEPTGDPEQPFTLGP